MITRADGPPTNPKDASQTVGVLREGLRKFGEPFEDAVVRDMGRVGYEIKRIGLAAPTTYQVEVPFGNEAQSIFVEEEGIEAEIDQYSMSVGMFRALAIVIHLNFSLMSRSAQCVLIDDIGEGLDFDRSSNLIKLVVDKIQPSSTQIIMTTNDRYVMNGIDLQYWSVLDRKGPEVSSYNANNRAEDFEEFKFTGLSNFDFLARDFLASEQ